MSQNRPIRTRFAPSPTGYLHVGGARTALFNYLFSKANNGSFILRIEDTDQERSTKESEEKVIETLKWLQLNWDEGPDKPANSSPYRQSERLDIYQKYANQLLLKEKAYRCFCTASELDIKKKQQEAMGRPPIYDQKCKHLTEEEMKQKLEQKLPFTIRLIAQNQSLVVNDIVQKEVKFDTSLIGDFIIVKSDGFPSYNFAVVIDDHLMKISHVIRGVGHLSNTPRQQLVYQALDWEEPCWAHVSEIVGGDHKKLSKRHGATSLSIFCELGYTAEALINYMSLLGWAPPDGQEFMSYHHLTTKFNLNKCSKSASMFDVFDIQKVGDINLNSTSIETVESCLLEKSKLNHLSNLHIRQLNETEYLEQILPFITTLDVQDVPHEKLHFVLLILRVYLNNYRDINKYLLDFFQDLDEKSITPSALEWLRKQESAHDILSLLKEKLVNLTDLQPTTDNTLQQKIQDSIKNAIKEVGSALNIKGKNLFMTVRAGVTGKIEGVELPVYISIIGKKQAIHNLELILKLI